MIDLEEQVKNIITLAQEQERYSMEQADWTDSIALYLSDILTPTEEAIGRKFNVYERDQVEEWLCWNQEESIEYIEAGFPYVKNGEYALASIEEIEIDLESFGLRCTPYRRDVINMRTDLYISDDCRYGYIYCGYDFIAIHNNPDTIIDALLESIE